MKCKYFFYSSKREEDSISKAAALTEIGWNLVTGPELIEVRALECSPQSALTFIQKLINIVLNMSAKLLCFERVVRIL